GTTTVSVQLVSLPGAEILSTRTDYNHQIPCGIDVIGRINYARRRGGLEELRSRVVDTVNDLITQIGKESGVAPDEICNAAVSGNTTMVHLLLGLNPEYIRLEPYTPTLLEVPYQKASEIGLQIHPRSRVHISPAVGSYVGGDITAGLLCTALAADTEDISLFIDIGTNGELAIGNRDFIMACACSAGPAFEGGGIKNGMRAAAGAIEKTEIDPDTGVASFQTIGKTKPKGICGSGMISLLANLFLTGWIDSAGKLDRTRPSTAVRVNGRRAEYIVVPAEQSGTDVPIAISELEIENIVRAKAAIFSACSLMLDQAGLEFDDLTNVYIAGGFGHFLDLEDAVTIGLLPDLHRKKFKYIGNSSLMGSYMTLVSKEYRQRQLDLARRITYLELSTDPTY
ncbi:MAG: ATP-binding protein, partial [Desulfobacterales bacterium]|nr:ATP-binding protein [Desulfobacterales bacterium]